LNGKEISSSKFRTNETWRYTVSVTASSILGVRQSSEKVFGGIVGPSLRGHQEDGASSCGKDQHRDDNDFAHFQSDPFGIFHLSLINCHLSFVEEKKASFHK
jgi:hypothetical protein